MSEASPAGPITITMDANDFNRLVDVSMLWHGGHGWRDQPGRFEPVDGEPPVNTTWARAYWVGDHWLSVMVIRSYLASLGEPCEVLWDMAEDAAEYVVLTNYQTH